MLIIIGVVTLRWFLLGDQETSLGNGYHYISGRGDDSHIQKEGKRVVDAAIIDIDIMSPYVVGLRLPAEHLECHGGYKIRLKNQKKYFILSTKNDELFQFDNADAFNEQLATLLINDDINLDDFKLETTWQRYASYYNNIDFSQCQPIPTSVN
ncbi:MAG: DUF3997 domain-containing protein [Cellvibrionaceae bacterium]